MNFRNRCLRFHGILLLFVSLAPSVLWAQHYTQTNLVSSQVPIGTNPKDPQLINPWGLTRSPGSPWWVSDNGAGVSTLYNGVGAKQTTVVTIPVQKGGAPPSKPTGVVFNGTATDFLVPNSTASTPSTKFIFVTEDGVIAAWNGGAAATTIKDNSKSGAVYKGCTIGELNGKHYLYVANFHSGQIEVYDSAFTLVKLDKNNFADDDGDDGDDDGPGRKPDNDKKDHFAPFNVQAIGTNILVAYAKQDAMKEDEVPGPGLGFVTVFDTAGRRLLRLQRGSWFNAPWGLAMAPGEFGEFSHALLVGMFGSGQIAAFNPFNGAFLGLMKNPNESILSITGLWALGFGAGNNNSGPYNTLFFTAGPNDEMDGLFGTLVPIAAELNEADEP